MSNSMTPYVAPKTLTVELPDDMGPLQIRPMTATNLSLTSRGILIEPNVYPLDGTMVQHGKRWHFLNKLWIGDNGARPSPKKQEAVALKIAGYINGRLVHDPEFNAALEAMRREEEARRIRQEENDLRYQHRQLQRDVEREYMCIRELRLRLEDVERTYQEQSRLLQEFEAAYPLFTQPKDLVEIVP